MGAPCDDSEKQSMIFLSRQGHRWLAPWVLSAIAFIMLGTLSSFTAVSSPKVEQNTLTYADPFNWDHIESIAQPRAFWWWLGSPVSKPEIDRQLQSLKSAVNPGRCEDCIPSKAPFSKAAKARWARIKAAKTFLPTPHYAH